MNTMLRLDTSLTELHGVGKIRFADLRTAAIETVEDLLLYAPLRYDDRTNCRRLAELEPDQPCLVYAQSTRVRFFSTPRRRTRILRVEMRDPTGSASLLFFNQPYLAKTFAPGRWFFVFGTPKEAGRAGELPVFYQPDFEQRDEGQDDPIHMCKVVPVYRRIGSCSSRILRRLIHSIVSRPVAWPEDPLPAALVAKHRLMQRADALIALHFPQILKDDEGGTEILIESAKRRLKYEEMFQFYLALRERTGRLVSSAKRPIPVDSRFWDLTAKLLPFTLTPSQKRALEEILDDMAAGRTMCRLLQGDVGSGKTIVALLAAVAVMAQGRQAAVMAPTEVLAEQHFLSFSHWLQGTPYRPACITSQLPASRRASLAQDLESGAISLAVGTQTLIQEKTRFRDLGLAVIDEQHRFGVLQRIQFREKGNQPDILAMTATPIPRTLALTLYGDLDISVIDELPPGRRGVRTILLPSQERQRVVGRIREHVLAGRQVYFVCPVIETSKRLEMRDVEKTFKRLSREVFPDHSVGLLHGKLPAEEKLRVMSDFGAGAISLLVCTTVIEVGIDVAKATLMVIENADRFGLAQLHQLRGRVGRGVEPGECILLATDGAGPDAIQRLELLCATDDGFRIAEEDLRMRGAGDLAGVRQSGIPHFRFIDLVSDGELIARIRDEAHDFLRRRPDDPSGEYEAVVRKARRLWGRAPIVSAAE